MSTSPNNGSTPLIALKSIPKNNEEEVQDNSNNDGKIIGKLTGSDFEFWINKDKVVIGRNSSHGKVDVNIGFSSYVSRKHLKITYYKKRFFLWCMGKNGVFVDGQFQRLGAEPLPLDKACVIRFPSTNIRLSFTPFPPDVIQQNGNGAPKTTEILKQPEQAASPIPISVPVPLKHKSVSPISNNDNAIKEKLTKVASPQPLKYLLPRDPHGFLSAPPSPTGTISALNSCPSSPGRINTTYKSQNVTDNLTAAASAIAASQQINDDHIEKGDGGDAKPPYSYAQLIIQAISSASLSQLTLSGIYAHITKHYPYYRTADKGWQNSIRHNLSLNRYFVKVPRSQEESGKGSFWRVDPHSERKLVEQAWRKRRQRAIPCFSAPLTTSVSTITRSAPVSPEHLSPMVKGSAQHNSEDNPLKSYDTDPKHHLIHFHSRYAQSAPGSPNNGQQISSSTSISFPDNTVNPSMAAPRPGTFLTSSTGVPLSNNSMSKMIWPLQPINNQAGSHPSMGKQENSSAANESPVATTFSHPGIDSSKVSIVMQQPPSSGVNASSLTSLTPQQRQLIQQQHLQQQVVMVAGQQHMQQGIPINIGTLVAAQNQMNNPGLPFIVPGTQQFLVKRVNENNDNDQIPLKKPKIESTTQ